MKSALLAFLAVLASVALVTAQDEATAISRQPAAARILGIIPDGTPPPAAPPRPKFNIPAKDVLET